MKRFLLVLLMTVFGMSMAYADLNPAQQALQGEIFVFLSEEGLSPDIDSDGDIFFKIEGVQYYVIIDEDDVSPMFVTLSRIYSYDKKYTKENLTLAQNEINLYKGIKVLMLANEYRVQAELYLTSIDTFKFAFYKLTNQLKEAVDKLIVKVNEVISDESENEDTNVVLSKIPFVVESLSVANVDYDGNIINDYGSSIYSNSTKYLKPQIAVRATAKGSYKLMVRFYRDNTMNRGSSSPEDYTYESTIDVVEDYGVFQLAGWGGNDSGHWGSGQYRFEIWYNGYCVGQTSFLVY